MRSIDVKFTRLHMPLYLVATMILQCPQQGLAQGTTYGAQWESPQPAGQASAALLPRLAQADPNAGSAPVEQGYANSYRLPPYMPSYGSYPPQPQPGYNPYGVPAQTPPPVFPGAPQPYSGAPYGAPPPYYRGSVAYAPQGLVMPISLSTAISTQVAKAGDFVQATLSQNVSLGGYSYIPAGTVVTGQITEAEAGRRLSRSGALSIQFNSLRMPDGTTVPISAHLLGSIGRYKDVGSGSNDLYRGEGWGTKLGQFALRGGLGAGLGAGLGTAVGAIAGGGHGAGMGAWSGAAIGGGIGAVDMLLRKGKDVLIPSGTAMQLQLDAPVQISIGGPGMQPPGMQPSGMPEMPDTTSQPPPSSGGVL